MSWLVSKFTNKLICILIIRTTSIIKIIGIFYYLRAACSNRQLGVSHGRKMAELALHEEIGLKGAVNVPIQQLQQSGLTAGSTRHRRGRQAPRARFWNIYLSFLNCTR
jgi:hypothetical protein